METVTINKAVESKNARKKKTGLGVRLNKLLYVALITTTTTFREKQLAAEESDRPRRSQVWQ